ncbi:MAG: hypothetical protein CMB80_01495 [Flammeovirgaceae bacterium]|nr:hypothetical protein [Flammeovirgaceae bacterium]
MRLIMENWRSYCLEGASPDEILLFEQSLNEGRATWGDLAKFVAGADPKTWKNRLKKVGVGGLKVVGSVGLAAGSAVAAPKIMAALGIASAGPKIAAQLIKLMGDDVSTWTEDKIKEVLAKIGSGIGTFIGSSAIMGAVDKLTKGTPLSRLNISDTITKVIDNKHEEAFYTFMNQWFKQNPHGPTGNPNEVIPKRWADNMFSKWLQNRVGLQVSVVATGAGAQVSEE